MGCTNEYVSTGGRWAVLMREMGCTNEGDGLY